jgi:hypothetical protein
VDNARPHTARRSTECLHAKEIQRIPHPAYGSDLAPREFFFGPIKQKLTECNIPDRQGLKSVITHIFNEIGQKILTVVFETWINMLE